MTVVFTEKDQKRRIAYVIVTFSPPLYQGKVNDSNHLVYIQTER